jgi:hypothetical protein
LTEAYRWLFVDHVPILYDEKKVARQVQVEAWLDLTQLVKELGIDKTSGNNRNPPQDGYIV